MSLLFTANAKEQQSLESVLHRAGEALSKTTVENAAASNEFDKRRICQAIGDPVLKGIPLERCDFTHELLFLNFNAKIKSLLAEPLLRLSMERKNAKDMLRWCQMGARLGVRWLSDGCPIVPGFQPSQTYCSSC